MGKRVLDNVSQVYIFKSYSLEEFLSIAMFIPKSTLLFFPERTLPKKKLKQELT